MTTTPTVEVESFDAGELVPVRRDALTTLFGLAFVLGGLRVGLARLDDNSFLWHFRTGRLILDSGIPHRDVYSYTAPGTRWIAQSWLAEALYALSDRLLGAFGIRLLVGLLGAVLGWLLWCIAIGEAGERLRAAGVTLVAFVVTMNIFGERPLAFGLVAAALVVLAVERPSTWLGRHPLVSIPVVFWLWGNTHGSMALGFAYVALHLIGRWLDGAPPWRPGRERTLAGASVIAAALIAVNPYGPALLVFPFDLVQRGDVLRDVVEWMSPDLRSPLGMAFAAWMMMGIAVLARARNNVSRRDVLVFSVFVLLGLWAQRNVALAAIFGLSVVARAVRSAPRATTANRGFVAATGASMAVLTAALLATAAAEPDFDLRGYPTHALEFVEDAGRLGDHIFMSDRDGGFAIAKYWPETHVFLDDRFDMYPPSVVGEYEQVARARPEWDEVLDRYEVDLVVWERRGALVQLLALSPEWHRIYADRDFVVYERVRAGSQPVGALEFGGFEATVPHRVSRSSDTLAVAGATSWIVSAPAVPAANARLAAASSAASSARDASSVEA